MNFKFRFTQEAVFCLSTINTIIRRDTGKIYRMSDPEEVIELIKLASASSHREVQEKLQQLITSTEDFSPETGRFLETLISLSRKNASSLIEE